MIKERIELQITGNNSLSHIFNNENKSNIKIYPDSKVFEEALKSQGKYNLKERKDLAEEILFFMKHKIDRNANILNMKSSIELVEYFKILNEIIEKYYENKWRNLFMGAYEEDKLWLNKILKKFSETVNSEVKKVRNEKQIYEALKNIYGGNYRFKEELELERLTAKLDSCCGKSTESKENEDLEKIFGEKARELRLKDIMEYEDIVKNEELYKAFLSQKIESINNDQYLHELGRLLGATNKISVNGNLMPIPEKLEERLNENLISDNSADESLSVLEIADNKRLEDLYKLELKNYKDNFKKIYFESVSCLKIKELNEELMKSILNCNVFQNNMLLRLEQSINKDIDKLKIIDDMLNYIKISYQGFSLKEFEEKFGNIIGELFEDLNNKIDYSNENADFDEIDRILDDLIKKILSTQFIDEIEFRDVIESLEDRELFPNKILGHETEIRKKNVVDKFIDFVKNRYLEDYDSANPLIEDFYLKEAEPISNEGFYDLIVEFIYAKRLDLVYSGTKDFYSKTLSVMQTNLDDEDCLVIEKLYEFKLILQNRVLKKQDAEKFIMYLEENAEKINNSIFHSGNEGMERIRKLRFEVEKGAYLLNAESIELEIIREKESSYSYNELHAYIRDIYEFELFEEIKKLLKKDQIEGVSKKISPYVDIINYIEYELDRNDFKESVDISNFSIDFSLNYLYHRVSPKVDQLVQQITDLDNIEIKDYIRLLEELKIALMSGRNYRLSRTQVDDIINKIEAEIEKNKKLINSEVNQKDTELYLKVLAYFKKKMEDIDTDEEVSDRDQKIRDGLKDINKKIMNDVVNTEKGRYKAFMENILNIKGSY